MNADAQQALRAIVRCIQTGRYQATAHFLGRMDERGIVWPDVLAALEDADDVRLGGTDPHGRQRWIVAGHAADDLNIEIVCALEGERHRRSAVFITIYWNG
jgi:hypothetical protein